MNITKFNKKIDKSTWTTTKENIPNKWQDQHLTQEPNIPDII